MDFRAIRSWELLWNKRNQQLGILSGFLGNRQLGICLDFEQSQLRTYDNLDFEQLAIGTFMWISSKRHLGILSGSRQSAIGNFIWISGQSSIENFGLIASHRQLGILFGFPCNRQLGISLCFGFQGNQQLGICEDFEQSALGNSIWISGQYSAWIFI